MIAAIIPARSGSKGIPQKNIQPVGGKPLLAHSIEHAQCAATVDRVLVSTDGAQIADVARQYGAEVVWRPPEISGDTASSESALLHALDHLHSTEGVEPELIVFLQCTSPIRRPQDIDRAVRRLRDDPADALLSVVASHRFLWRLENGEARSLNYDYRRRPRRQDRAPEYVESGSLYVCKPQVLRQHGNRLGGRIALFEMDYWSGFEIDSPEDLALCDWILRRQSRAEAARRLPRRIGLLVLDFDGVFTDNRVVVSQDGSEAVLCDRSDGHGLSQLVAAGVSLLVLSKEANPVVQARCRKLQLECQQGIGDKHLALEQILAARGIPWTEVLYVGNDVGDLACMRAAGFAVAPADAYPEVRDAADLVLDHPGGRGAVRELSDLILESRLKER